MSNSKNDDRQDFIELRRKRITLQGKNKTIKKIAFDFLVEATKIEYSYNWNWLGVPIIQYPEDIMAMQELVWTIKPDLIIETGVARGGSIIFYASLLSLIGKGMVIGIDIDVRKHNRKSIESHSLSPFVKLVEGSSTSQNVIKEISKYASAAKTVLVALDSSHDTDHVARELELYSPFVTKGSYIVAFDTITDFLPPTVHDKKESWGTDHGPYRAVKEFLNGNKNFVADKMIDNRNLISVAPGGYLRRIK